MLTRRRIQLWNWRCLGLMCAPVLDAAPCTPTSLYATCAKQDLPPLASDDIVIGRNDTVLTRNISWKKTYSGSGMSAWPGLLPKCGQRGPLIQCLTSIEQVRHCTSCAIGIPSTMDTVWGVRSRLTKWRLIKWKITDTHPISYHYIPYPRLQTPWTICAPACT